MSHDLRNPLAAIVTNLEFAKRLLGRAAADPDLVESVDDSVVACDVLRRIVGNLDVLVRGPNIVVSMHEFDIVSAINEVVERCVSRAEQASMRLEVVAPEKRVRAMLDRALFTLAVENLIANSLQYAPRSTVVRLTLAATPERTSVAVEDDGAAVPEALRERATSVAAHTPSGRSDATRYGRGLGLLAARVATSAMGCELTFDGDAKHSVMSIEIPALILA
jgi:signal transduction histidine kinase